jgi:hypothetical protein
VRSHREWPLLQIWSRQRSLAAWVAAEHLRVARLEPVTAGNRPAAVLDLRFVVDGIGISVPACIVDAEALEARTRDALIWPHSVAEVCSDAALYAIECSLIDWLRAESLGTGFKDERIRRFDEGDQTFEAARYARLLGATPYETFALELAAAHYAARFVPGKVVECDTALPNAAAILAPSAAGSILADLDPARSVLLRDWFGCAFLDAPLRQSATQLAIVLGEPARLSGRLAADARVINIGDGAALEGVPIHIGASRALDDLVRLGEQGSAVLSVRMPQLVSRARTSRGTGSFLPEQPAAAGGSQGRILQVLRADAFRADGADTDEASALRRLLIAEGFTVDVAVESGAFDPSSYDLVHGFGMLAAAGMHACFVAARTARVPTVLTAFFEDHGSGALWGARASRSLLDLAADEKSMRRMLDMLAARMVVVDGVTANERFDDGGDAARIALVRDADFVLTHSTIECELLERFAQRTENLAVTLPLLYRETEPLSVAHLVPDQAYMLVQAGIEARQNVGLVLQAVSTLEIPCVFAGPILDRRLYRHLASRTSTNISVIPECSAPELAAIAESAAVFIDAAWFGDGTGRILRSILHGSVAVLSESRPLDEALEEAVVRVDPASIDSLRNGISEAWQRAGTLETEAITRGIASRYNVVTVFQSIIAAYAAVNERPSELVPT